MGENLEIGEAARLEALRRLEIMDTIAEPEFDELVEMAAAICETPMSVVAMLDENRQWFKAAWGVDITETSREMSFCTHTIQQTGVMVVEDATADERFCENPNVIGGLGIRFYAGVPVYSESGHPIGTLCVADTVARKLSDGQIKALHVLGRRVSMRLALREQRLKLEREWAATKAANVELMEMASTDVLTGLNNRRAFEERLRVEFGHARRRNQPLAALLLDIDNFKQHNDQFGHDAGDHLLMQFARVLRSVVRGADLVVRYGGEEFLVLMPDTHEAGARWLGERILATIRMTVWPVGPVTASVGCATLNADMGSGAQIVANADEALYAAKRSGKDRVVCYTGRKHLEAQSQAIKTE
jgi:diguanylate cyclase (GGDEF)-like protein